jgi:hypothetical protein
MEDLQCVDIFRKRGLLIDDSFQLLVLFFDGIDTFPVLSYEVFGLQLDPLCKACDFLILDDDPFVEIGPKLVLPLVEVFRDFVDFILEEKDLELIVVDDRRFRLL